MMASSRSPIPQMPFGCTLYTLHRQADPFRELQWLTLRSLLSDSFDAGFDNTSNFPYPSPPTPAPGPSLLDDSDNNMLGDFFDRVNSSTFDDPNYFFEKLNPAHGLNDLQYGWGDSLPPTFHGTTTSLSHVPLITNNLHDGRHGSLAISPGYPPTTTSQDVLAAAALLQNGHAQLVHSPETPVFPPRHTPHNSMEFPPPGLIEQPLRRQSSQPFTSHHNSISRPSPTSSHHRASTDHATSAYYPDMMFPGPRRTNSGPPAGVNHHMKSVDVRWGSDVSFLDHGYVAPPGQETEEKVTSDMIHTMDGLLPQASGPSTRAPSPRGFTRQHAQHRQSNNVRERARLRQDEYSDDQGGVRSRRKRKVSSGEEVEDEDDSESAGQLKRRKKAATGGRTGGRSRKSMASDERESRERSQSDGQKASRENLTEEQKRSNHILSEQKRRNLIKQGFDDLCELVPDLKGGGYSKSAMLVQAADWLEDMLKGNEELRLMLASLKGRNGV